jgi:hypothetical protein
MTLGSFPLWAIFPLMLTSVSRNWQLFSGDLASTFQYCVMLGIARKSQTNSLVRWLFGALMRR